MRPSRTNIKINTGQKLSTELPSLPTFTLLLWILLGFDHTFTEIFQNPTLSLSMDVHRILNSIRSAQKQLLLEQAKYQSSRHRILLVAPLASLQILASLPSPPSQLGDSSIAEGQGQAPHIASSQKLITKLEVFPSTKSGKLMTTTSTEQAIEKRKQEMNFKNWKKGNTDLQPVVLAPCGKPPGCSSGS